MPAKYSILSQNELEHNDVVFTKVRQARSLRYVVIASLVAAYSIFITIYLILTKTRSGPPVKSSEVIFTQQIPTNHQHEQSCGSSPAQARANGCVYDHLAHLWLSKDCSRDRNSDYLTYNNGSRFSYYLDGDAKQEVDIADQEYHTGIFSTTREHLAHCAFTLLRTSDWMRYGGAWERKVVSPDHVEHCVMLLFNASMYHPQIDDLESFTFLAVSGQCYTEVLGKKTDEDVAVFPGDHHASHEHHTRA